MNATIRQTSGEQALAVEALKEAREYAERKQWVHDQRQQGGNFDLDMLLHLQERGWHIIRSTP